MPARWIASSSLVAALLVSACSLPRSVTSHADGGPSTTDAALVPTDGGPTPLDAFRPELDAGLVADDAGSAAIDAWTAPPEDAWTAPPEDAWTAPPEDAWTAPPDAFVPRACNEQFGTGSGYLGCSESATTCEFYANPPGASRSCDEVCTFFGSTCVRARGAGGAMSPCGPTTSDLRCNTATDAMVCTCAR